MTIQAVFLLFFFFYILTSIPFFESENPGEGLIKFFVCIILAAIFTLIVVGIVSLPGILLG